MTISQQRRAITAKTVDLIVNATFGSPTSVAKYEGLCVGDQMAAVTGAVVCYAPTVDILRRATAEGRNLVITREHPFYLHGGLSWTYVSEGLLREDPVVARGVGGTDRDLYVVAGLAHDPVVAAKRALIDQGGLIIYRQGAAWDQYRPAAQSAALARAIGLHVPPDQESARRRGVVCDLPTHPSITELVKLARESLSCASPRIVGEPGQTASRVAVLAGETDPVPTLADLLSDTQVDCVITGAGGILDEVDGGIAYFLDVLGSGRQIAMLTLGHGPSHEPGVQEMTDVLRPALADVDLQYWPSGGAGWIPELAKGADPR